MATLDGTTPTAASDVRLKADATIADAAAPDRSAAEREKVRQLAREFESMLITQMLRDMRRSMLSDDEEPQGLGAETMTDTIDAELGSSLGRAGGIGLAAVLLKAFDRQVLGQEGQDGQAGQVGQV